MTVSYGKGTKGKATKLHAQLVRARGACERCGVSGEIEPLQCAHIISRRYSHTRCDTRNAWALCGSCHYTVDNFADEKMDLVQRTIGEDLYWDLKADAYRTDKVDWEGVLADLKECAESLASS